MILGLRLRRTIGLAALFAAGCRAGSPSPSPPTAPTAPAAAAGPRDDGRTAITPAPREPAVTLTDDDCRAFRSAAALGIAVVTTSTPDCSGIGHDRSVLEVRRLARGHDISTIVATRSLAGMDDRLAVGATLIVAIIPERRAAETLYCVALPARDGLLGHSIAVDSLATAERVLGELAAGRACPPPRCPAVEVTELAQPTSSPGRLPHPGWSSGAQAHREAGDALAAGDVLRAAERFMTCGFEHDLINDRGPNGAVAADNAGDCFELAARAYAAAGRFEREGRAALAPAAHGSSPVSKRVQALLASPPSDCATP